MTGGLPSESFGAIASALFMVAQHEARAAEAMETLVLPRSEGGPTVLGDHEATQRVIADLRISGRLLGELYLFFEAWAPRESDLRQALAAFQMAQQNEVPQ
ncbi:MAG TPA: hypothetical protein VNX29_04390 [Kaistia sp.]|nr:hypothetical protein [Kaistia sp.]